MRGRTGVGILLAVSLFGGAGPGRAQTPGPEADTAELARLRRQIEAITRELEALRLGREVVPAADTAVLGLGPAASKVYRVREGVSIAGYGEFLYENFARATEAGKPSGLRDRFDALRGILYVGYKFGERALFNSEIEFEHGSTGGGGSVSVEFAYVDYRIHDAVGLRGGLLLIPMGFLNELHEPPVFLGTTRPETERAIIPTTWRENGLGLFGEAGSWSYRAYLVTGFDAVGGGSSKAEGFGPGGLRGGRQKGAKAEAESFAGVVRLDYSPRPGVTLGASLYVGGAGQGRAVDPAEPGRGSLPVRTVIWEGHGEYRSRGLEVRALAAVAAVGDAAALNRIRGLEGRASVGERLAGGYLQVGYDVLRAVGTGQQLIPYVRYEGIDTQARVPEGYGADPVNRRRILALGAAWKPIPSVVVKGDYQLHRNGAGTGVDRLNLALGYLF